MSQLHSEKSIGELFTDLTQGVSTLVRQEVQLAKTEISEHISAGVKGIGFLVVAGCLAFVGFQVLVAAAVLGLSLILNAWLAALIVSLALLLIAGVLLPMALNGLKKMTAPPEKTIETLKEDAQWIKQQTK
jgi:predicted phage tail protein